MAKSTVSKSKGTTTPPFFKFDTGLFLAETMGLSDAATGLYVRTMALYWEAGCVLPDEDTLSRRLSVRTGKGREMLAEVLDMFFDEDRKHVRLDQCLAELQQFSRLQSERASARHRSSKAGHEEQETPAPRIADPTQDDDPDDF